VERINIYKVNENYVGDGMHRVVTPTKEEVVAYFELERERKLEGKETRMARRLRKAFAGDILRG